MQSARVLESVLPGPEGVRSPQERIHLEPRPFPQRFVNGGDRLDGRLPTQPTGGRTEQVPRQSLEIDRHSFGQKYERVILLRLQVDPRNLSG